MRVEGVLPRQDRSQSRKDTSCVAKSMLELLAGKVKHKVLYLNLCNVKGLHYSPLIDCASPIPCGTTGTGGTEGQYFPGTCVPQ